MSLADADSSSARHQQRDLQLLEWARQGPGVRFALTVHHTDAEREWAYDRKSSIGKYQTATCDELKAQKKEPPSDKEKEAIEFLRNDSEARISFINKIAAPVLNKMFDCGMIP